MCEQVVCVSKLFVDKLCVRQAAGGRRRKQAGVHKQKQERHTKMWGKKHTPIVATEPLTCASAALARWGLVAGVRSPPAPAWPQQFTVTKMSSKETN